MTLLAVDTTSEFGSLALSRDGVALEVAALHSPDGFGHVLFQAIRALVERHGLALSDIDGYAGASGPGSFTGVRVGLTAIKGLAEAHGKRVVAISNLQALAWAGRGALRAAVIDARRGEVYAAVYDEAMQAVAPETVGPLEEFLQSIQGRAVTFVVTEGSALVPRLAPVVTATRELAGPVAALAALEFAAGRALPPEQVDANYIRRSDAELKWKEA